MMVTKLYYVGMRDFEVSPDMKKIAVLQLEPNQVRIRDVDPTTPSESAIDLPFSAPLPNDFKIDERLRDAYRDPFTTCLLGWSGDSRTLWFARQTSAERYVEFHRWRDGTFDKYEFGKLTRSRISSAWKDAFEPNHEWFLHWGSEKSDGIFVLDVINNRNVLVPEDLRRSSTPLKKTRWCKETEEQENRSLSSPSDCFDVREAQDLLSSPSNGAEQKDGGGERLP